MNKNNRGMHSGNVGKAPTGAGSTMGKYDAPNVATKVKGSSGPKAKTKGFAKVKNVP